MLNSISKVHSNIYRKSYFLIKNNIFKFSELRANVGIYIKWYSVVEFTACKCALPGWCENQSNLIGKGKMINMPYKKAWLNKKKITKTLVKNKILIHVYGCQV